MITILIGIIPLTTTSHFNICITIAKISTRRKSKVVQTIAIHFRCSDSLDGCGMNLISFLTYAAIFQHAMQDIGELEFSTITRVVIATDVTSHVQRNGDICSLVLEDFTTFLQELPDLQELQDVQVLIEYASPSVEYFTLHNTVNTHNK